MAESPALYQHRLESCLFEIPVPRQSLSKPLIRHHYKGDAVRQRPFLVVSAALQFHASGKKLVAPALYEKTRRGEHKFNESSRLSAPCRSAECIRHFRQHPPGRVEVRLSPLGEHCPAIAREFRKPPCIILLRLFHRKGIRHYQRQVAIFPCQVFVRSYKINPLPDQSRHPDALCIP